jgi:hypothetical protein
MAVDDIKRAVDPINSPLLINLTNIIVSFHKTSLHYKLDTDKFVMQTYFKFLRKGDQMTREDAKQNLSYLKTVAEQGANAPLLGGRIGLMWTALLVPTLSIHGLSAMGKIGMPESRIGLLWLAFGFIGGILSAILSRNLDEKPGAGSLGNRVEAIVWPVQAVLIFGFAISIVIGSAVNDVPVLLFNTIMPFAFALSAVSLVLLGRLTEQGYLMTAGIASALFMVVTTIFVANPLVYIIAAIGVVFTGVVPNIIQMRKEPANV